MSQYILTNMLTIIFISILINEKRFSKYFVGKTVFKVEKLYLINFSINKVGMYIFLIII